MPATPTGIFASARQQLAQKDIDLKSDTIKAMLVLNYSANFDTHQVYSDASGSEISGTGYTAGGQTLAGVSVTITPANSWGTTWAASTAYKVGQIVKPATSNGFVYRCTRAGNSAANVAPSACNNGSPAVITATGHNYTTGNKITLSGITGNTNLNGTWLVVVQSSNTYEIMDPAALVLINSNGTFGGTPAVVPAWPTVVGESFTDGGAEWVCFGTSVLEWTATNPSWSNSTLTADGCVLYKSGTGGGTGPLTNPLICCLGFGSNVTSTNGPFTVQFDPISGILAMA